MHYKLPVGWNEVLFPEVIFFQEGPGIRKWQFRNEGIKLLNVRNIVDGNLDLTNTERHLAIEEVNKTYKHFMADAGDLVMASSGVTWGKTAWVKEEHLPLCMNTSTIRLRPLNEMIMNKNYMRHFIDSKHFKQQMERMVTGAAQPNFGPAHLKQVVVPLPPLEIQDKIVSILDEADNLRKLRKQAEGKIKELIPALFDDMFGDPVTNPRGWEIRKLGDIVSKENPQIMPTDYPDEMFTYIGLEHIESNTGKLVSINRERGRDIKSLKNRFVPGDILYGRLRPYLNKVWLADTFGICSTEILVLKPVHPITTSMYVSTLLKLKPIVDILNSLTEGANLPRVKPSGMNAISVAVPPLSMQEEFSTIAEELSSGCAKHLSDSTDKLDHLFNSLMDRCMSGDIG